MHGFSSHTFKWVNKNGEVSFVKLHFLTDSGIKNLSPQKADELKSTDDNYATRDLFDHIQKGNSATWTVHA